MKKFSQFIIFVLFGLALFVLRDDIVPVIDKVTSFLYKNDINQPIIKSQEKQSIEAEGRTDTPGALRIPDNILSILGREELLKEKIIEISNRYRKENGNLPALVENNKLNISATKKMQDMFNAQYFEHESPSGVGVGDLGLEAGYEYIIIGENLAMGNFKNNLDLVDAWMNSPGHRANILNTHYTEIGVSVGLGVFEGNNVWMAVQHFGVPKSICPNVDNVLYGIININQNKLKEIFSEITQRDQALKNRALYEGSTYGEQVTQYNDLVTVYNNLINETKIKINKYNTQIEEFNKCLYNNK